MCKSKVVQMLEQLTPEQIEEADQKVTEEPDREVKRRYLTMHPSEYLRRKLVSDKEIHLTELSLIINQIENHSFKMNPEVQRSLDELKVDLKKLSDKFEEVLVPEIVDD